LRRREVSADLAFTDSFTTPPFTLSIGIAVQREGAVVVRAVDGVVAVEPAGGAEGVTHAASPAVAGVEDARVRVWALLRTFARRSADAGATNAIQREHAIRAAEQFRAAAVVTKT
jgi:hypothetical protein